MNNTVPVRKLTKPSNYSLSIILCSLMVATSLTTWLVRPTKSPMVLRSNLLLTSMIPESFAGWTIDPNVIPLQLSEAEQKGLNQLYSQTLVRTYVNAEGARVMLSIAYGGDQSGNLALHKPEHCYGAQGFAISDERREEFKNKAGSFSVARLLAVQGQRSEPITYWTTVGDKVVLDGVEQKIQKLKFAMTGKIPDGILVRVSTIDTDTARSYKQQNTFIHNMLDAMNKVDRNKLVGMTDL